MLLRDGRRGAKKQMKGVKRYLTVCLLIFTLISGLLGGCGKTEKAAEAPAQSKTQEEKRKFTDSLKREVEIPKKIERYIVSGPLAQIAMFALAPDEMVARSSDWTKDMDGYIGEKYKKLPDLGQLYGGKSELNKEEVLKLDPQVIIDVGEAKKNMKKDMDELNNQTGIPTVHIDAKLENMGEAYKKLGELMGKEKEAEKLTKYCDETYQKVKSIMEKVADKKTSMLYCMGDAGSNVVCKHSYHGEVFDLLANNLAEVDSPSSKGSGNEVNFEQILKWNPDAIIFSADSIYSKVADDPMWKQLKAVQNKKYYEAPAAPYNWMGFPPSVQRYLGMVWMAKVLYPEQANYDLKEEVSKFYDLFYHCNLKDAQYEKLMEHSLKQS